MTDLPKRPRPAVPIVPGSKIVCQHCPRSLRQGAGEVWGVDGSEVCFVGASGLPIWHKPMPKVA
jgi:hypothetical protein